MICSLSDIAVAGKEHCFCNILRMFVLKCNLFCIQEALYQMLKILSFLENGYRWTIGEDTIPRAYICEISQEEAYRVLIQKRDFSKYDIYSRDKKHAFLQMLKKIEKKCPTGVYNLWVYEERHVKSFI